MESNKNRMNESIYCRISNIQQTLKSNCILYLYSKDKYSLDLQEQSLKDYCNEWLVTPKKIYKDLGGSNFLKNKKSLNKMLLENSNVDILVLSADRISRDLYELYEIESICKEKGIRFFDAGNNNYVFEEQLNCLKRIGDDYGL